MAADKNTAKDTTRDTVENAGDGPPIWEGPRKPGEKTHYHPTQGGVRMPGGGHAWYLEPLMIYGYPLKTENEHGLVSMREISFRLRPEVLRAVARMLEECAEELENGDITEHWHRHCPPELASDLDAELIVTAPEGYGKPSPRVVQE